MKFKKLLHAAVSLAVLIVLISSIVLSNVNAQESFEDELLESAKLYVAEQIKLFAAEDPYSTWDDSTVISSYVELYSPEEMVNGYIFQISTGGLDSGFMQIGVQEEFYVVNLGYEGSGYLADMIEAYNLNVSSSDDIAIISDQSDKAYYIGGFDYYVYNDSDELVDLLSCEVTNIAISDLVDEYEAYIEYIDDAANEEYVSSASTSTYTVADFDDAYSYLVSTTSFSGYSNHCAPTAATNMVLYWKYARGYFSSDSSGATTIFKRFYSLMGTTSSSGTTRSKIEPAYTQYFISYSGTSADVCYVITSVTMAKIKTKLNSDIPLHLSIDDYVTSSGTANHSVNVWGYYISGSTNYIRITNNLGTAGAISLLNYTAYDYAQFVYAELY